MNKTGCDIAIIGMSGVFPKADNIAEFYENLCNGVDAIGRIPAKRLALHGFNTEERYQELGVIEDIDLFDHSFFGISKSEAELIDPNQRMMLQMVATAILDSGYSLERVRGSDTAVVMAAVVPYYGLLLSESSVFNLTSVLPANVAGRVNYSFDFRGPSFTVDTSCSTSLTGIIQACDLLNRGVSQLAVVGAINLIFEFFPHRGRQAASGITAPDGRSKAFSAQANGTGWGEGGGVVVLKRLDQAVADGDVIHAVIKGGGLNHDGRRTVGMAAPSVDAQTEVILQAWKNSEINPEDIGYVEAHGTGTPLGDPIEVAGLSHAFNKHTSRKNFCALGTVKSNIGHLNGAAGMAGLLKAVLSISRKKVFPSLHFTAPNPNIEFQSSALFVNTHLKDWDGEKRIAVVSSFGVSGTNGHIVLREPPEREQNTVDERHTVIKLSAKNERSLNTYLMRVKEFMTRSSARLADIAFTLNDGRDDFQYRLAFTGSRLQIISQMESALLVRGEYSRSAAAEVCLLLSSDSQISTSTLNKLCEQYKVFRENVILCKNHMPPGTGLDTMNVFAFQFAMYHLLHSAGITFSTILASSGVSSLVAYVIRNEMSLSEAAKHIETQRAEFNAEKFISYTSSLRKDHNVLFVEAAGKGELSDVLSKEHTSVLPKIKTIDVHTDDLRLDAMAFLYVNGATIDWQKLYEGNARKRVQAPTYEFEGVSCWVKTKDNARNSGEHRNTLYATEWTAKKMEPPTQVEGKTILLIGYNIYSLTELKNYLEVGNTCIILEHAAVKQKINDKYFTANFDNAEDLQHNVAALNQSHLLDWVLYVGSEGSVGFDKFEQAVNRAVYSLLAVIKPLESRLTKLNFRFSAITFDGYRLPDTDNSFAPVNALSAAVLRALLVEYPLADIRCVDISSIRTGDRSMLQFAVAELCSQSTLRFSLYRGGERFVPVFSKATAGSSPTYQFKPGATYVVTGGAGGIGASISDFIAANNNSKFIVLGRTELPPTDSWKKIVSDASVPSDIREKVQRLNKIVLAGSTVDYYAVDVEDADCLDNVVKRVREKYGSVEGVIHAAGLPPQGKSIKEIDLDKFKKVLAPKVKGTLNLFKKCKELKPAFFVQFSSLISLVPRKNTVDYTVANSFQLSFADYYLNEAIAIGWPDWDGVGMSASSKGHRDLKPIRSSDANEVFRTVLSQKKPNIFVADFDASLFLNNPFFLVPAEGDNNQVRPVETDKVGGNSIQAKILSVWIDVLKSSSISVNDSFFDLGGHSLNGSQIINGIKNELGVDIDLNVLFEYDTIESLAKYIAPQVTQLK